MKDAASLLEGRTDWAVGCGLWAVGCTTGQNRYDWGQQQQICLAPRPVGTGGPSSGRRASSSKRTDLPFVKVKVKVTL